MKAEEIKVERNDYGVFANATVLVQGVTETVTIWGKPGHYAESYLNKSDSEIQKIALAHWREFSGASLGSATSKRKAKSSAENGKLGGRPRKKKAK